jgi:nucleotide-binding universal stress UspA family protein
MGMASVDTDEEQEKHMTENRDPHRIVVGVDGSDGSVRALEWALAEARLRGVPLHIVHAWQYPALPPYYPDGQLMMSTEFETESHELVDRALKEALGGAELDVAIKSEPHMGTPVTSLLAAAEGAALLVVGSRGRGGFAGLVLGSVGQQCAQHAPCPVVIVPNR